MAAKLDQRLQDAQRQYRAGDFAQAERLYRQVLQRQPFHGVALVGYATLLCQSARAGEGVELLRRGLRSRPGNHEIVAGLAEALAMTARPREAMEIFREAIAARPDDPRLHAALGSFLLSRFNPEGAISAFRRAIELAPHDASLRGRLADALFDEGLAEEAGAEYEVALRDQPSNLDWQTNLATSLRLAGRHDESLLWYDRIDAGSSVPIPESIAGRAEILQSRGRIDDAYALLRNAIDRMAPNPTLAAAFARVCRARDSNPDAIQYLRETQRTDDLATRDRAMIWFALGAAHEGIGEYDAAFTCYRKANALGTNTFDKAEHVRLISKLIDVFSADRVKQYPRADVRSELPVFIVGMPRSGTSLVEQVLAAHPQIHGAGELRDMTRLIITLPERFGFDRLFPDLMPDLTSEIINQLAEERLTWLQKLGGPAAVRVTDKLPHNFMMLGLINRLLPQARIIHCSRDPLDNLLSCYTTQLPLIHSYQFDFENLACAYSQYRRLMKHWKASLDSPIFDVAYESMVEDQEAMTRRLIEFIGVEWNDACLKFYESKRVTHTASVDQVRRPVYRSSVGRAERFGRRLDSLRAAIERWVDNE